MRGLGGGEDQVGVVGVCMRWVLFFCVVVLLY